MAYKQSKERNKRLERRYKKYGGKMSSGVWYDKDDSRYKEYHLPRRAKYIRDRSNRKIRRTKCYFGNHGTFKKVYDVWWEVW